MSYLKALIVMKYQTSSIKHFTGTTIAFPPTLIKILIVEIENSVNRLSSLPHDLAEATSRNGKGAEAEF